MSKKRWGHKKAIIAIARILLTAIYNILFKNEPYNPELYAHINTPPKQRTVSVEKAIFILQRQGYLVTPTPCRLYRVLLLLKSPFFLRLGFVRPVSVWYLNYNVSIFASVYLLSLQKVINSINLSPFLSCNVLAE